VIFAPASPRVGTMSGIDTITLRFSADSLYLLNGVLGLVMFGIALDLELDDFRRLLRDPRGPAVGLVAQFLVLPWATLLLTLLIDPEPSIALGMLLVASCPGGNVSNFITHLAKGRTVLSVTMTAVSTAAALVMTPLNVSLLGSLNPKTAPLLKAVALDPLKMLGTVFVILGLPLTSGMIVSARLPKFAARARRPMVIFSIVAFMSFIVFALRANFDYFIKYVGVVAVVVALHNATALAAGYFAGWIARLPEADRRAISVEVGIQNSGLGLVLIFDFFAGLGGMAVVAAFWGMWHIIAGLALAFFWSRRPPA